MVVVVREDVVIDVAFALDDSPQESSTPVAGGSVWSGAYGDVVEVAVCVW